MKRGVFFFIILYIIFIFNATGISAIFITNFTGDAILITNFTGDAITGKPLQTLGMNITVIIPPILILLSPENETYLTNISLLLNYSVFNATSVWYSIDGGINITITSPIFFNVSQGAHSLFLHATNQFMNVTESVNFNVNSTLFTILWNEYNGTTKGNSTDFAKYTYEKLQNLGNVTLENINFGKISFNQNINLTDDENFNDYILDLDNNTNISFNKIELNSTALPNFNKQATLWFYNLTFSNPRILIDGGVCPPAICTVDDYSGGILKFNVNQFSAFYSAEETPPGVIVPSGGGGGGGIKKISAIITPSAFNISVEEIKIKIQQGTTETEQITITNNRNYGLDFTIEYSSQISDLVRIKENTFHLNPGESKTIDIDIIATKETVPDLYIGEITVKAGGETKKLLTAIEVESAQPLFDVNVEIPKNSMYVLPGNELSSNIEIYNLGIEEEVKIRVNYIIMDSSGNIIIQEEENRSVNTKLLYTKKFMIPEEVDFGRYVLYVKINYNEKIASSSAWFNIGRDLSILFQWVNVILLILIIIVVIISIIMIINRDRKRIRLIKRTDHSLQKRLRKVREIQEKLSEDNL